jgi:hypothetical protein
MASTFPTALDTIPNSPTTEKLGESAPKHSEMHDALRDAIVAVETRIGVTGSADAASLTHRTSAAGEGSAISALTAKTTPVDADLIGLSDSAAGGVLKKLSWSNIKAALQSVFATLAGVVGGQTLIGGTAASETLTLRSTSHATKGKILFGTSAYDEVNDRSGIGTTSPSAKLHVVSTTEQERLGYDAATYLSTTVSNLGAVTYNATGGQYIFKGANSIATLGSELVTNGAFTSDLSGWTDSGASWSWSAGTALHTAGSASTLSQNITVATGNTYYIELTITGRTAGTISVSVGSVSMVDTGATTTFGSNSTYKKTLVAAATGAVALTLTPTSTFDGAIDTISVKNVTQGSVKATHVLQNSDGSIGFELRSGGFGLANTIAGSGAGRSIITSTGCTALGYYALQSLSTGVNNSAVGYYALGACTIASNNTAFGYNSEYSTTSGSNNSGFGNRSLYNNTTGGSNCALGYSALESNTAGANNTGVGMAALFSQGTGSNNVALGSTAGRYIADSVTANAACDNSIFIGYNARPQASGQSNQTVIGHNAVGLGANTTVIGNSATLTFKAFGTPILTPAASSVPTVNGELTVEATSNTSLTFRLKGTDGTVRSASLTLA